MPRGPLPLNTHAALEPIIGIVLIASPWIFGFSNVDDAKTLAIVLGVAVLLAGMMTRWRVSLVKLIPIRTHFMMDVGVAILMIAAPWIFGFSDSSAAARFFVIAGVLELGAAMMTDWDESEEIAPGRAPRATA